MGRGGRQGRQGEKSERRFPTIRTSERKIATLSTLSPLSSSHLQCPMPNAQCPMPNAQHYKRETNPIAPPANTNQAELILNRNTAIALTIARVIVNQSTSAARPNV